MTTESDLNKNEVFLKLLAQSEVILRSYLRSLVYNQNDLSEVMQNTFIVGWKKYDQFSGSRNDFTKWLCIIGKYEALKYRQSQARDRHILSEELVQQIANEGKSDISSYSLWIGKLEECITKLSPANRELIKQAYSPSTSIKDLAMKENKTANALYQKLSRIRNQLATCMDKTPVAPV
jgi:RNA polymerase sigma-70 factor (ECF subfamily)